MCTAAGSGVSGWGRASAWRAAAQCGTHALTVHSTSSSIATASARPGKCSARRASCAARLSSAATLPLRDGPASALLIVGGGVEEARVTQKGQLGRCRARAPRTANVLETAPPLGAPPRAKPLFQAVGAG